MSQVIAGVSGVNRVVKKIPLGVSGVNRNCKEAWAGVSGVNKKVFSSFGYRVETSIAGDAGYVVASINASGTFTAGIKPKNSNRIAAMLDIYFNEPFNVPSGRVIATLNATFSYWALGNVRILAYSDDFSNWPLYSETNANFFNASKPISLIYQAEIKNLTRLCFEFSKPSSASIPYESYIYIASGDFIVNGYPIEFK